MGFNASTAYADDGKYVDDVEAGTLYSRDEKNQDSGVSSTVLCKREAITASDLAAALTETDVEASDALIVVWKKDATDSTPKRGDRIELGGVGWHILHSIEWRRGPRWRCICRQELQPGLEA